MSFKTELEWFDPKDKLPDIDSKILFKTKSGFIYFGEYESHLTEGVFRKNDGSYYEYYEISWWAYAPELE